MNKRNTVVVIIIALLTVLPLLGFLIYNRAFENIPLLRSDKNVTNELAIVEEALGLKEENVDRTSVKRNKGRTALYDQSIERPASATGFYFIENLTLDDWIKYRNTLLSNYSSNEKIRTGCDDNPDKLSSCELTPTDNDGEAILRRDWYLPNRAHTSCYEGPRIDEKQISTCLSISPGGYFEYSKYAEDFNRPKHNVKIQVREE